MVNIISGAVSKSPSQSPGQWRRYANEEDQEEKQKRLIPRRKKKQKKQQHKTLLQLRLDHNPFCQYMPEPKKEERKIEERSITPYSRSRESSGDRRGAS